MVMRRSDSKTGKGLSNLTEQHPKRTKVHAQRKFAQGSGMNSPSSSPVKGKEKAKANGGGAASSELLPSKRPKAEDFLTFLCFRGTKALPPRLDFFNRAAESDKSENAPASSKSQSNQETKPKIKNIVGPKKKMIKDKEQTSATRIMDMKQKTKTVLRSRALIKKRQNIVSKTEITRAKRKPSILKRMGRVRKGLRSAGELPPGSDEGIKTDRKPRTIKEKPEVKPKPEKKEKKKEVEEEDVAKVRKSFRAKKSPQNKNVKVRPSRKTKEAAALYMEIINDDELEDEKGTKVEKEESEKLKEKSKKKGVAMKVTKKISQIHRSHNLILKRLGTSRMRSGLRSASETENVLRSKQLRSKKVLKAVKKIDKGTESDNSDVQKGQRSCKKSKRGQYAGDDSELEDSDVEIKSDRKTRQSSKPKGAKKVKIEDSDGSEEIKNVPEAKTDESEDERLPKKVTRRSSKVKVEADASEESESDVKSEKKVVKRSRKDIEDSKSVKKSTRSSKAKVDVSEESEVDEKSEKKVTRGSKIKAETESKEKAKQTKIDSESEDEAKIEKRITQKKEETDSDNNKKVARRTSRVKTKSEERETEKKVKRSHKDDIDKVKTEGLKDHNESSDNEQKLEKKKRVIKSKNDAKDSDDAEPEKKIPKRKTEESDESKNGTAKGVKRVKAKTDETKEDVAKTVKKVIKKSKQSSESEDEDSLPKSKPVKRGRPAKLKLDIKEEPVSDESSQSESIPINLGKRTTRQKGSLREQSTSESDYSSGEEVKMPFRMSTRKRHTPRAAAMKTTISKRPSRKTKEAATIYMEMLTKDLRSPDEEDSEFEDHLSKSDDEDEVKLKKETKSKSPESSKKERPSRVCRGKKNEYFEPKSSEESDFEEPKDEPETKEVEVEESKEVKVETETEEIEKIEPEMSYQEEEERRRPKRPKLTARDPDDRPSSELDASRLEFRVRRRSDSGSKKDFVPDSTVPTDDVVEALMSLRDHVPRTVPEPVPQPQEENRLKPLSVQIFPEELPKNMSIKKPSVNETWRQAFKNAKIPKPGHISPAPRAVEPFVRKPFFIKTEPKPLPTQILPKITPKSLTQLQYEKRSSDLISGLKETPVVQKIEGKHLNLPLAVDTLRKMAPTTVTKKPIKPTKPETSCSNLLHKKKVNMSTEEIKEWLNNCENDPKDIEMYDNLGKEKVDRRVVEAPVRLKELDTKVYEQEMIAKCRVEDYKEKMSRATDTPKKTPQKSYKSNESMTEEEMFEYDFRFDRNSVSSDDKSDTERKIFQQRRSGSASKRSSPTAFSAENESSVYAFEPDLPPPAAFRRRSRVSEESPTTSIAVQVNLENEKQEVKKENENLESSTQTDENEGQLFYFPFDDTGRQNIQGVAVKLQSDGPEQRVIMRAKLVTKPSDDSQPSSSREPPKRPQKPEQKVRPLTSTKPLGTVQPTVQDDGKKAQVNDRGTSMKQEDLKEKTNQGTQSSPIEKVEEKDENIPTRSKSSKSRASISSNEFPIPGTTPCVCEAPVFRPTEKEFQDPLEYILQITPEAQSYGICKIIPPSNFKPECKVSDDMRFIAYNQYVHKMLNRWGPNVKEMSAIKKYLATQSITLNQLPWIGGMEIDLPRLYQTVQTCGGLKEVIEKKRWTKVADAMKIPKSAQDRVTKLDDIYCKYLLPYDTLSHEERSKLLNDVELEWSVHEKRILEDRDDEKDKEREDEEESESDSDDRDECIIKGRSMALSQFFRIARNTMSMWFKEANPNAKEVETEFWKHVTAGVSHLCVHSGSIDSGSWGYGFPTSKTSATSRHPWNLKVLTNNNGSILRSLGPAIGVTVPTLHVGMLFSACCWYRDPHSLPWIEYLHTGASKIWYGVPDSWCEELRAAVKKLLPGYCRDRKIWLASDTAMVPPELLVENGVSLCRTVQEPGQFILVFPKAFTSSICTGYSLSESVYFAQPSWLNTARLVFKDIQDSCEPPIFSLEKLLFNIALDVRSSPDVLNRVIPMIADLKENEIEKRRKLEDLGLKDSERLNVSKGRKKSQDDVEEYECEVCNVILFLSLVSNSEDDCNYCLDHAIETLTKDKTLLKHCKLMISYDEDEMDEVMDKARARVEQKTVKKQVKNSTGSK